MLVPIDNRRALRYHRASSDGFKLEDSYATSIRGHHRLSLDQALILLLLGELKRRSLHPQKMSSRLGDTVDPTFNFEVEWNFRLLILHQDAALVLRLV